MRTALAAAVLSLAAFAAAASESAPASASAPVSESAEKPTLAVIDFVAIGEVGIKDAGQAAAELLLANLSHERHQLIERSQLAALLKEADLTLALVQDNPQKVYGKLKGVRYLVLGSVTRLGDLTITARLVEVATGKIVQSAAVSAEDARGLKDAIGELATQLQMTQEEKARHLAGTAKPAAAQYVRVLSRTAGRVTAVKAAPGQTVKKGDLLVRVDDAPLQADVKRAQAEVDLAKAEEADAARQFDRTRALLENGAATKEDLAKAQTARDAAQRKTAAAQAALTVTQNSLEATVVYTPVDGVVAEVLVGAGETVAAGQEVVVIRKPVGKAAATSTP